MNPRDRQDPTPIPRAVLGAIAGWFTALFAAALGTGLREPSPVWPVLLVSLLGLAGGGILGGVAGSRELRGAAAHSLMGGLVGAAAGCVAGAVGVLVAIGSRWDLLTVFSVPIALGATLGATVGRLRHGGRVTVGECMAWVAVIAFALSLGVTAWRL